MKNSLDTSIKYLWKIVLRLDLGEDWKDEQGNSHHNGANYFRRRKDGGNDGLYFLGKAQVGFSYAPRKKGEKAKIVGLAAGNLNGFAVLRGIIGDDVPISLTLKKGEASLDTKSVEETLKQAKKALAS